MIKKNLINLKKEEIIKQKELNNYLDIVFSFLINSDRKNYIKNYYIYYNLHKSIETIKINTYLYKNLFNDDMYNALPREFVKSKNSLFRYEDKIYYIDENKIWINDLCITSKKELYEYLLHDILIKRNRSNKWLNSILHASNEIYEKSIKPSANYVITNSNTANMLNNALNNILNYK